MRTPIPTYRHQYSQRLITCGVFLVAAAHAYAPEFEHIVALCVNVMWIWEPEH